VDPLKGWITLAALCCAVAADAEPKAERARRQDATAAAAALLQFLVRDGTGGCMTRDVTSVSLDEDPPFRRDAFAYQSIDNPSREDAAATAAALSIVRGRKQPRYLTAVDAAWTAKITPVDTGCSAFLNSPVFHGKYAFIDWFALTAGHSSALKKRNGIWEVVAHRWTVML